MGDYLVSHRNILQKIHRSERIYVKIYGNIKNPGIYELKEGEILKKLIDKAGGFINNKDNLGLDLDSVLQDGQVIYINFR